MKIIYSMDLFNVLKKLSCIVINKYFCILPLSPLYSPRKLLYAGFHLLADPCNDPWLSTTYFMPLVFFIVRHQSSRLTVLEVVVP